MEKFESEIYKKIIMRKIFPELSLFWKEKKKQKKTERKVTALAEEYLSFNNNETKLEKDLNDMLEKINSLDRTTPSSEFLKGQLCLELYDIYNNNPKENEKYLTDVFFEPSPRKLFGISQKRRF